MQIWLLRPKQYRFWNQKWFCLSLSRAIYIIYILGYSPQIRLFFALHFPAEIAIQGYPMFTKWNYWNPFANSKRNRYFLEPRHREQKSGFEAGMWALKIHLWYDWLATILSPLRPLRGCNPCYIWTCLMSATGITLLWLGYHPTSRPHFGEVKWRTPDSRWNDCTPQCPVMWKQRKQQRPTSRS